MNYEINGNRLNEIRRYNFNKKDNITIEGLYEIACRVVSKYNMKSVIRKNHYIKCDDGTEIPCIVISFPNNNYMRFIISLYETNSKKSVSVSVEDRCSGKIRPYELLTLKDKIYSRYQTYKERNNRVRRIARFVNEDKYVNMGCNLAQIILFLLSLPFVLIRYTFIHVETECKEELSIYRKALCMIDNILRFGIDPRDTELDKDQIIYLCSGEKLYIYDSVFADNIEMALAINVNKDESDVVGDTKIITFSKDLEGNPYIEEVAKDSPIYRYAMQKFIRNKKALYG